MANYPSDVLPGELWGPYLMVANALNELERYQVAFIFASKEEGRLKRVYQYRSRCDNQMDLHDFPCDCDEIALELNTRSSFLTKDETVNGEMAFGKSYRLRWVERPEEGVRLRYDWDGEVPEFETLGASYKLDELPPNANGTEFTKVSVGIHVARKPSFFFSKGVLPLWLLTYLSTIDVYNLEVSDVSTRSGLIATYFLAAFAMLYVVGEALPRTDFLTKVDWAIMLTTCLIAVTGTMTHVLLWVEINVGPEQATTANQWTAVGVATIYVVGNLLIFAPPLLRARSKKYLLTREALPNEKTPPPTVRAGFHFIPTSKINFFKLH